MPNWCDNTFTLKGPTEKVNKIYQHYQKEGNLLDALYPPPADMFEGNLGEKERKECAEKGIPNWYDWQSSNWGTKWDISDGNLDFEDAGDGEAILSGYFMTAWAPPHGAFDEFIAKNDDCYIHSMYYEPGMGFAGIYEDGSDDQYELTGTKQELIDSLPEELDDAFGITESIEEEPEELSEWMKEGAEARKEAVSG